MDELKGLRMKRICSIISFIVLLVPGILSKGNAQNHMIYPDELRQLHQNVWENIMDEPVDLSEVAILLSSLSENGSWPDIDYTSKQRGAWEPRSHITRLLEMAKAYQTKGAIFYHRTDVSEKIQSGLNYWLENDFICPNWWYPEIGVPKVFAPVLILMEAGLSPEQLQKGIKIMERSKIEMTGQNKVWLSGNVLLRSLLLRDVKTIKKAAESIQEELVVSSDEGVQPDWSYHQHGPQLQFGNYGLAYANDMIKWVSILRRTPFHFNENKVSVLRNYLLDGQQWVTWNNRMDISACGRQLFIDSPSEKAQSLAGDFEKMEKLDPNNANAYRKANDYKNLAGNKHFWRSDFQVQRNPDYYFSVKMNSERVIGAESCNSENIQGYYMGDGATYLYQTAREFKNIFPFWDWKKIPGTTIQQDNDTLPVLTSRGYRIPSNFVGGVSDGKNGVAVMNYIRNGLDAHKSWFMFDDMIVCLGSGINSSEGLPVTTSVNQAYLHGDVIFKTSADEKRADSQQFIQSPKWILHDNIGYLFPTGGMLVLETKQVEGSWHNVALRYPDKKMQADIFKLWLEHGVNPKDKSYEYILVPNANRPEMIKLENRKPFYIQNEIDRQEVISVSGDLAGVVFYKSGRTEIFGGVEVNRPCVLMLKKQATEVWLSIADPTQLLNEIEVVFSKEFSGNNAKIHENKTVLKIPLPNEGHAGETVRLVLKEM